MKSTRFFLGLAAAAIVAALALGTAVAGDGDEEYTPEQFQAFMEAIAPGDHHKHLKTLEGTWNVELTMWQGPEAEPVTSKGTSENKLILGDRFIMQHMTAQMMGMPFEGIGLIGFDRTSGKHTTTWADNMSTHISVTEGTCANHCMTETYITEMPDPFGNMMSVKFINTIVDDDKYVFEWFQINDDGSEFKAMEIVYTRS